MVAGRSLSGFEQFELLARVSLSGQAVPQSGDWFGAELGYLTNRNGNFFDKNTFRLGVNWDIGRYMSVSPCLYISDNFNKMYPGIRLGIGF